MCVHAHAWKLGEESYIRRDLSWFESLQRLLLYCCAFLSHLRAALLPPTRMGQAPNVAEHIITLGNTVVSAAIQQTTHGDRDMNTAASVTIHSVR